MHYVILQGNGYITDPTIIANTGISDPNPFFQRLLASPHVNNVVIGTHLYPPSITLVQSGYTGQPLFQTLTQSVGYLNGKGYCSGSTCHQFPIIIGETGSALTDPRDTQFYNDFQLYIQNTGAAQDGAHAAIDSFFWWRLA